MEKSILIVDDSKTIRQQVRITLEAAGFKLIEADTLPGPSGVTTVMRNSNSFPGCTVRSSVRKAGLSLVGANNQGPAMRFHRS